MASLSGKVVIITGASGGIGRAITERLAKDGATVVINYGRGAEEAQNLVQFIEANGGKAPFGRIGRAEDIADVVAFLVIEESRWITGQHIVANGRARF